MKRIKTGKVIWGIVGALLILIISQIAAQVLASLFASAYVPTLICNIAAGILYVVFAYFLLKIFAKRSLKVPMEELGIPKLKIETKWVLIAFALPTFLIGIYLLFPGTLQKGNMDLSEAVSILCAGIFFTGIGAGIVEEMVFRGVIMNLLDKRFGRKAAILVPSLLFGLVHIIGMGFDVFSCLQVVVAGTFVGIMFSLIALEKHSIWNSAVVHAVWNSMIVGGFLHIGEAIDEYSVFTYVLQTKSFVVTGGEFGIESSVIAILGYAVVAVLAGWSMKKRQ